MASVTIVEGIDRVGKTTLANRLVECSGDSLVLFKHCAEDFDYSLMDSDNEADKMLQLLEMVKLTDSDVVFDRFHLSEFAYGLVCRDYAFSEALENFLAVDYRLKDLFGGNVNVLLMKSEDMERSEHEHGSSMKFQQAAIDIAFKMSSCASIVLGYSQIESTVKNVIDAIAANSKKGGVS